MTSGLLTLLPELVELAVFGLGSLVLSGVGVYIEQFALSMVGSGQPELSVWAAVMGAMAFGFSYLLATDQFRPRLQRFLDANADRQ
ncbi:hypothetical protein GL213_04090 [Halogeometricum borinquense]|uniref:DUF8151 domain-containing protein n=1 Tax=Halogeometricum borinquense TaxID=60847 RepID=A0A482TPK4_9EURY|nr:hypothetical protein [Halogeometricum borinquense]QIB75277.1 hypothetical protein G3I44_13870 [Halogeometricum borinquense]QIQ75776.1 hypothetical protein GL213_04090 [Halogeometricum borinquense]RYJ15181.1 hypothetical protein ELS19_15340 [Halogeometricum borinquense]